MALKIITKRRYINNVKKTSSYINRHWGKVVADEFLSRVENKLLLLSRKPNVGVQTDLKNVRSVLAGKGFQNKTINIDRISLTGLIKKTLRKFECVALKNEINDAEAQLSYLSVSLTKVWIYCQDRANFILAMHSNF